MTTLSEVRPSWVTRVFGAKLLGWLALLGLSAAFLNGGITKAMDFTGAVAEMKHFGLWPPALVAVLTITLELGAPALILCGICRWAGALALAGFTLCTAFLAHRFWELAPPERFMEANAFFDHMGLIGGLLFVAWHELRCSGARDEGRGSVSALNWNPPHRQHRRS